MAYDFHVEVYEATVKGDHRTCFTKVFAKHDKLRFMGYEKQYKILKILSDAELVIEVAGDDQLGEIETIIGKYKFGAKTFLFGQGSNWLGGRLRFETLGGIS